jgi:hypothetical protein
VRRGANDFVGAVEVDIARFAGRIDPPALAA